MATKKIVRWVPAIPGVYGRREISVEDFENEGIFTQRRNLVFAEERRFWLAADDAEISDEAIEWLVNNPDSFGTFTVEEQEVPDELLKESAAPAGSPQPEGESVSTSTSTAGKANTTTSTATS